MLTKAPLQTPRVDYGQDAPAILRGFLEAGILLLSLTRMIRLLFTRPRTHPAAVFLQYASLLAGIYCLIRGGLMIYSNRVSKILAADDLLDGLCLQGREIVLDVGCGHGLLLIKAAQRLPAGRAIGIDLWSQVDQDANNMAATMQNARIEGVAERIELHDGDMCNLHFLHDNSIDAVVACKAIHNVPTRIERRQAIAEIVRVLAPGGHVAIIDILCIDEFAEDLREYGMQAVQVSASRHLAYPRLFVVTGRKAA